LNRSSLLLRFANGSLDGSSKDVTDAQCVFAQHVGVDAQGHCRICVAEPGGQHMHGNSGREQRGRVQVTWIMQAASPGMVLGLVIHLLWMRRTLGGAGTVEGDCPA
jgi:hypothetical protein